MIKQNNFFLIPYNGIQTLIPIRNGSLDFSGIPSPGREILQGVVDQWVADGNTLDLTIIPEPEPDPVADWQGWQIAQLQDPTWVAYCQTIPVALTTALTTLVSQVATQPDTVTSIAAIWAGIAAAVPPDPVAQAAWVARAESFNLPTAFVSAFAA